MSYEDLIGFVHSIDHSLSLRIKFKKCKNDNEIYTLAKNYGFNLSEQDIAEYFNNNINKEWFKNSKIREIKKFSP